MISTLKYEKLRKEEIFILIILIILNYSEETIKVGLFMLAKLTIQNLKEEFEELVQYLLEEPDHNKDTISFKTLKIHALFHLTSPNLYTK